MSFRNQPGSLAALSISTRSSSCPPLTQAPDLVINVSSTPMRYTAFTPLEEKKYKEEIEKIDGLYQKFLDNIVIKDFNDIQNLPPIFKLPTAKKANPIESIYFTDNEVKNIGLHAPHMTDITLANYQEYILNAISILKSYYFSRKERKDVTTCVISYLLYILEKKGLYFEGYTYDIAYLNALINFIRAYASIKNRENTQHFSHFNDVYKDLLNAKHELEYQYDNKAFENVVHQLADTCLSTSKQMLKQMVKMIMPNEHWNHVSNATMEAIASKKIRNRYIHSEIKGIILKEDEEVVLPDSIFTHWITTLATYYLQTLASDKKMSVNDILSPDKIFIYPHCTKIADANFDQLSERLSPLLITEIEQEEIQSIRKLFSYCKNYMTTKLGSANKHGMPQFMSITDAKDIIIRSKLLSNYAILVHQLISLQYLSSCILKSIKELENLTLNNPTYLYHILNTADELCTQTRKSIEDIKEGFIFLQNENNNAMQLEEKEDFPKQIKLLLDTTMTTLKKLNLQIKARKEKITPITSDTISTNKYIKQETYEIAAALSNMYHIDVNNSAKNNETSSIRKDNVIKRKKANTHADKSLSELFQQISSKEKNNQIIPSSVRNSGDAVTINTDQHKKIAIATQAAISTATSSEDDTPPISVNEQLITLVNHIHLAIQTIQQNEQPDKHIMTHFLHLDASISAMKNKLELLQRETQKTAERSNKITFILNTFLSICNKIILFLQESKEERVNAIDKLSNDIHSELFTKQAQTIDIHQNQFFKFITMNFEKISITTETRDKFTAISRTIDNIAHCLKDDLAATHHTVITHQISLDVL